MADLPDAPFIEFGKKLARPCLTELSAARRDHVRYSDMTERLAAALELTVAMAAKGDAQITDSMLMAAER